MRVNPCPSTVRIAAPALPLAATSHAVPALSFQMFGYSPQLDRVLGAIHDDAAQCAQCRFIMGKVRRDHSSVSALDGAHGSISALDGSAVMADGAHEACATLPAPMRVSCDEMVTKWGEGAVCRDSVSPPCIKTSLSLLTQGIDSALRNRSLHAVSEQ